MPSLASPLLVLHIIAVRECCCRHDALAATPARMPVLSGTRCVCVCDDAHVVWRAGAAAAASHRRSP